MRVYLRDVTLAERDTVRLLGARRDADHHAWWVDDTWPDLHRFDRWLPGTAIIADVNRSLDRILGPRR